MPRSRSRLPITQERFNVLQCHSFEVLIAHPNRRWAIANTVGFGARARRIEPRVSTPNDFRFLLSRHRDNGSFPDVCGQGCRFQIRALGTGGGLNGVANLSMGFSSAPRVNSHPLSRSIGGSAPRLGSTEPSLIRQILRRSVAKRRPRICLSSRP